MAYNSESKQEDKFLTNAGYHFYMHEMIAETKCFESTSVDTIRTVPNANGLA